MEITEIVCGRSLIAVIAKEKPEVLNNDLKDTIEELEKKYMT
jgi:hypothetical protein